MCIRDSDNYGSHTGFVNSRMLKSIGANYCLLYTSDAADDLLCVDLGGRRIIKKTNSPANLVFAKFLKLPIITL